MSDTRHRVLIIEDEVIFLEEYIEQLEEDGQYDVDGAEDLDEARAFLSKTEYAVVLTDVKLHAAYNGGLIILDEVKSAHPATKVIVFSGIAGTEEARQAQRFKTDGYLTKPLDFDRLRQVVRSAVGTYEQDVRIMRKRGKRRRRELPTPEPFVLACRSMSDLRNKAARTAAGDQNVIIYGEPGTGKGLIAEGIHFGSERNHFELINCGSLSERSLDRILFGHQDESTGQTWTSVIERVNGGTLVLDRISGLSLRLQEKLLAVLSEQEFTIGDETVQVDIRVIGIDNSDLDESVQQKLFLQELYDLLNQAVLNVPPLRTRYDDTYRDVLILADHFIEKYSSETERDQMPRLSPNVEYIFEAYPFPGNVAELESVIRVALEQAVDGTVESSHLPAKMQRYGISTGLGKPQEQLPVQCPHGSFYCNRTAAISNAYETLTGVYVRLSPSHETEMVDSLRRKVQELGMTLLQQENYTDALVAMCNYCVPVQSSHYAVIDISEFTPQLAYEVGLLHSLGVPTLVVTNRPSSGGALSDTQIVFNDASDLLSQVEQWLSSYI